MYSSSGLRAFCSLVSIVSSWCFHSSSVIGALRGVEHPAGRRSEENSEHQRLLHHLDVARDAAFWFVSDFRPDSYTSIKMKSDTVWCCLIWQRESQDFFSAKASWGRGGRAQSNSNWKWFPLANLRGGSRDGWWGWLSPSCGPSRHLGLFWRIF